jgi:hypothetical protein
VRTGIIFLDLDHSFSVVGTGQGKVCVCLFVCSHFVFLVFGGKFVTKNVFSSTLPAYLSRLFDYL